MATLDNKYDAPHFKHTEMTLERVDKFISSTYFSDVNLRSRLVTKAVEPKSIAHVKTDNRFSVRQAVTSHFEPVSIGFTFGPIWSTHWFRVTFEVDGEVINSLTDDDEVLLRWNSGCEAALWDEGTQSPIGAFSCGGPFGDARQYYPVSTAMLHTGRLDYLVEAACNTVLGDGDPLFISPPKKDCLYTLKHCDLIIRKRSINRLISDLQILKDMASELKDTERGMSALFTANHMINILQSGAGDQYERAEQVVDRFFAEQAVEGQHVVHAVGHCHMDCAWLWPYEETKRKCARSWAATLELMQRFPSWNFACSSAQQYQWLQTHYPELFDRVKEQVSAGRFQPVGGSWVEMDGNLPSAESMCRQLLYGQRYFLKEFNLLCTEFWLPDTFGYSAQLPQIMCHFRMNRFFTQKISWSLFNKFPIHTSGCHLFDITNKLMVNDRPGGRYDGVSESKCRIYKYLWVLLSILCIPPSIGFILYISCYMRLCASVMEYQCRQHHTFYWEGLDGSRVLSHFAPGESYHMKCMVKELLKTEKNFQDKGRSRQSLYLFGHGDGGQGPTQPMLQFLDRVKDVSGLPR